MPKPATLHNLLQDLVYITQGTYVHQWLFGVCQPAPGLRVLEPGCGSAKFATAYALRGSRARAFDIDPTCVYYAGRLKAALEALLDTRLNVMLERGDIFGFGTEPVWDLVLAEGTAQHWPPEDPRRQNCLDRMAAWCRPNGRVAIIGNNGLNPKEQKTDREFNFGFEGMPARRTCFTPDELRTRLEQAGLHEVRVEPLGSGDLEEAVLIGGWGIK